MVLDVDGKAFFAGIEARAARHRPALHHAVEFEPQIVMQPPRRMFLNDVAVTAAAALAAARLRRHAEFSFFSVNFESHETINLRLVLGVSGRLQFRRRGRVNGNEANSKKLPLWHLCHE